jgi:hypothetical protein
VNVLVQGEGIAAYCCAHLLKAAGIRVGFAAGGRAKLPAILVNGATQHLACDVFGRADLFAGLPQITERVVAWGGDAVTVPHSAVVISEEELAARLRPECGEIGEADWTVYASRPLPAECVEHRFGSRTASAHQVTLRSDAALCWIESLRSGWLFLISTGWLLAVGAPVEELLAESRLVAAQIAGYSGGSAFPAHPRAASPLAGSGWLSCGSAALGFDPICGDGTGYAIREGILAAAVIRSGGCEEMRRHYARRVIAGFQRHLELCEPYYRSGGSGPWWHAELAALREGIAWCRAEIGDEPFRYRLNGFDLEPA